MRLVHATPTKNLPSIARRGLLRFKARGALPVVWLHTPSLSPWAVEHTQFRHGSLCVSLCEVSVVRSNLRRGPVRGTWYCVVDISPDRIRLRRLKRRINATRK